MNNSMINPSVVELLRRVDDRYALVIVTSKRARQIIAGSQPLVDIEANKPLTIAINEFNEGEFGFEIDEVEEKL